VYAQGYPKKKSMWEKSSGGVEEFVALNLGGDAEGAVGSGLDPDDFALAANVDVTGLRDLFGKGDDEIDEVADVEFGFGNEIEAPITDVTSLRFKFDAGFVGKHPQGKGHTESPCYTAFGAVAHEASPRGFMEI
jgi:hypothetical protein